MSEQKNSLPIMRAAGVELKPFRRTSPSSPRHRPHIKHDPVGDMLFKKVVRGQSPRASSGSSGVTAAKVGSTRSRSKKKKKKRKKKRRKTIDNAQAANQDASSNGTIEVEQIASGTRKRKSPSSSSKCSAAKRHHPWRPVTHHSPASSALNLVKNHLATFVHLGSPSIVPDLSPPTSPEAPIPMPVIGLPPAASSVPNTERQSRGRTEQKRLAAPHNGGIARRGRTALHAGARSPRIRGMSPLPSGHGVGATAGNVRWAINRKIPAHVLSLVRRQAKPKKAQLESLNLATYNASEGNRVIVKVLLMLPVSKVLLSYVL